MKYEKMYNILKDLYTKPLTNSTKDEVIKTIEYNSKDLFRNLQKLMIFLRQEVTNLPEEENILIESINILEDFKSIIEEYIDSELPLYDNRNLPNTLETLSAEIRERTIYSKAKNNIQSHMVKKPLKWNNTLATDYLSLNLTTGEIRRNRFEYQE